MADLYIGGQVAGADALTVRLTVLIESDFRDERGFLPLPVYLYTSTNGGPWVAEDDSSPTIIGSVTPGIAPIARCVYVVNRPGLPPFARTVFRRVYQNTDTPGVWDWTLPDDQAPAWDGTPSPPPSVNILPGQGPRGRDGASMLFGEGPPAPGLGNNGDTYLDHSNMGLYGRSGGLWRFLGGIMGAQGPKGGDGLPGAKGDGFLKPTSAQRGFFPVADGSQPYGFSWVAAGQLGFKKNFLDLDDVLKSSFIAGDTYVLRYREDGRIEAVSFDPESAGGGGEGVPDPYAYGLERAFPRLIGSLGIQVLGDVPEGVRCYVPPQPYSLRKPVYRVKIEGGVQIASSVPFYFGPATQSPDNYGQHFNSYWPGGCVWDFASLEAGEYFLAFDPGQGARFHIAGGQDSYSLASGAFTYGVLGSGFYEGNTSGYVNSTGQDSELVFRRDGIAEAGARFFASLLAQNTALTIALLRMDDAYSHTGTPTGWEVTVQPGSEYQVIETPPVPESGYYGIRITGQGKIAGITGLRPGVYFPDSITNTVQVSRVTAQAEIMPGHAAILTAADGPHLYFRTPEGVAAEVRPTAPIAADPRAATAPIAGFWDNGTDPPRAYLKRENGEVWASPAFALLEPPAEEPAPTETPPDGSGTT